MKIICAKNEFQKAVNLAERSSSKNTTLPILAALLISTSKNKMHISSTNLEVGFEAQINAKIESDGEAALSAKTLSSLLGSLADGNINLEKNSANLKVSSKGSATVINCFPHEEFPVIPKIKKENHFEIPADILVKGIDRVISFTSNSNTKPELASVFFHAQSKIPLTLVTTDSFRLAEQKTSFNITPISLLLPQRNAQEVARIFENVAGNIDVIFNQNQISFSGGGFYFISNLTEGKFPDYQSIIPKAFSTQIVMDKNQLTSALRAAGVFSSRLSEVSISASVKGQTVEVKSSSSETGEHISVTNAKISGEDVETVFNYRYLLEALSSIGRDKVFLGMNGRDKALFLRGHEENSYLHLIMPMRGI
ncbi:DNA polymerase III subunit beta [Candidatus Giovannonibacteria bacterium]|nr:DNA polymerase III subunit beta [Candidatus Giovannonibacteria bacterium]